MYLLLRTEAVDVILFRKRFDSRDVQTIISELSAGNRARYGFMSANNSNNELEKLRRELQLVTADRDRLLSENRLLVASGKVRQDRGRSQLDPGRLTTEVVARAGLISKDDESLLSDRIRIYRSLFRGRDDVYARFWQSKQTGKAGYSPACGREWDRRFCQKPGIRCGECPNRELLPITDVVIREHLEGKITVGIYPLLSDECCCFLAIDFDKHSWLEDSAAFLETCRMTGIPAALERSRSGQGGHVWIFFSEAVSASAARNLGCYLLTQTMSRRHQLGMDSYDRLFPNQDTMPKGGFGNLIALPFQKVPSEEGNTLFLDREFKPYADQWSFLASVDRMKPSVLDELVRQAVRSGQVIGVRSSTMDDEPPPWVSRPSERPDNALLAGPFPSKIRIVISDLVYVEKEGLSSPLVNKIRRIAAFQNPEFYRKQKLRLSTALTPRVICCAEDFDKYLGIPRGCFDELKELVSVLGVRTEVCDKRCDGVRVDTKFRGKLTLNQAKAAAELLGHDEGMIVAPSGSGKTVIGISVIASRKINTLILVHRRPLLEQWRAQLASFLDVDPEKIGQVGGGKDKRYGLIDVAMLQSLVIKGRVNDLVAEYGQVIVDECHHLPAFTFEQVLRKVKARYVVGLTATPYRRDGQHPIILMQCGPVRHEIRLKDQSSQASMRHRLMQRYTNFVMPTLENETPIQSIYAALVRDEQRNRLILNDVLESLEEGRSPILLTERREHLEFFEKELANSAKNVVVFRGGMGSKQRRAVLERLAGIPADEGRILLATGRYIGEGFDDPRLDSLFLALPVSWKGTLVQYAGRLHRVYAGKTDVRIYDYIDRNVPVLQRMFQRRLRGYRAMGYEPDKGIASYDQSANPRPTLWDILPLSAK